MLASAALAAAVGAGSLCALVLHLDAAIELRREVLGLALSLFLPWWLALTALLAVLALLATGLRWWRRPFRPVVPGYPFFASFSFLVLALVAFVYWQNLLEYRLAIAVLGVRALAASAVVITAAAVVFLAVGLDLVLFPRHERPLAAVLSVLCAAAAVAGPLALRPTPVAEPPRPPVRLEASLPARRLVVVGIDGLSPADLAGDAASAQVPALARLAARGAMAPLATIRPTDVPPVWTTLLTGQLPREHGISGAFSYRLLGSSADWRLLPRGSLVGALERARLVSRRPLAPAARRRRALWNLLDSLGVPSGLVRVAVTQPPEPIRGFVLSPYFDALVPDPARAASALRPKELLPQLLARAVRLRDIDPALLHELAEPLPASASPLDDPALRRLAEEALAPDLTYQRAADVLRPAYDPALLVVVFQGYDLAGHAFYRYAHPEAFGNVDSGEARRYGRVLGGYGALLARWVTDLSKASRPGDLLVVVSGHGLAPTPLWRRLLGVLTGTDAPTAEHDDAPAGVLVMSGEGIRPGARSSDASVLDVMPTLLYLMGLPVARDMEGRVLTELVDPDFARENPVTFIGSYESLAVEKPLPPFPTDDLPPLPDERP